MLNTVIHLYFWLYRPTEQCANEHLCAFFGAILNSIFWNTRSKKLVSSISDCSDALHSLFFFAQYTSVCNAWFSCLHHQCSQCSRKYICIERLNNFKRAFLSNCINNCGVCLILSRSCWAYGSRWVCFTAQTT